MSPHIVAETAIIASGAIALAPAVWWVAGAVPSGVDPDRADYLMQPPQLGTVAVAAIGIGATALVLVATPMLWRAVHTGRARRHWLQIVGAVALFAGYLGLTYRFVTTPVIGANIGGGLMILGILPIAVGLATWIFIAFRDMRRAQPTI